MIILPQAETPEPIARYPIAPIRNRGLKAENGSSILSTKRRTFGGGVPAVLGGVNSQFGQFGPTHDQDFQQGFY